MHEEDEAARELLQRLDTGSYPLSTVDMTSVLNHGRKRVRRRQWAMTAAAATVILAIVPMTMSVTKPEPTAAPFPTSCTAEFLPLPLGANSSQVFDVDSSGRFAVGQGMPGNIALFWDRGQVTVLAPPGGDAQKMVVNSAGVVAGTSTRTVNGKAKFTAWVLKNGQYRTLGTEFVIVQAINDRDEVLTQGAGTETGGQPHEQPSVWGAGDGYQTSRKLAVAHAFDLDRDGTVVGSDGGNRGVVWSPSGAVRELPQGDSAQFVRGDWLVGYALSSTSATGQQPTRWNQRTGGSNAIPLAHVNGVNAQGWAAGYETGAWPAVAGGGSDLLKLPIPAGAKEKGVANALSGDGKVVVGNVELDGYRTAATLWTCR